jgi:pilus assembly protein Flp/PilA
MKKLSQFLRHEKGATAIEYGLIAGLIAVVLIGALTFTGSQISAQFNNIANHLNAS